MDHLRDKELCFVQESCCGSVLKLALFSPLSLCCLSNVGDAKANCVAHDTTLILIFGHPCSPTSLPHSLKVVLSITLWKLRYLLLRAWFNILRLCVFPGPRLSLLKSHRRCAPLKITSQITFNEERERSPGQGGGQYGVWSQQRDGLLRMQCSLVAINSCLGFTNKHVRRCVQQAEPYLS